MNYDMLMSIPIEELADRVRAAYPLAERRKAWEALHARKREFTGMGWCALTAKGRRAVLEAFDLDFNVKSEAFKVAA